MSKPVRAGVDSSGLVYAPGFLAEVAKKDKRPRPPIIQRKKGD